MASLGHVAVAMAAGRCWTSFGDRHRAGTASLVRAMVAFSALSLAPDLDVIAFRFGIPYSAPFGHRGARMLTRRGHGVVMTEALQFAPLLVWSLWPRRGSAR
jgi:inner membrane protein